jgi:hypothetical protein
MNLIEKKRDFGLAHIPKSRIFAHFYMSQYNNC